MSRIFEEGDEALDGDEAIVDEIDVPMEAVTVDIATNGPGIPAVTSDDDAQRR